MIETKSSEITEDLLLKRAANLSSMESYSLAHLSVGTGEYQMLDGKSETVMQPSQKSRMGDDFVSNGGMTWN